MNIINNLAMGIGYVSFLLIILKIIRIQRESSHQKQSRLNEESKQEQYEKVPLFMKIAWQQQNELKEKVKALDQTLCWINPYNSDNYIIIDDEVWDDINLQREIADDVEKIYWLNIQRFIEENFESTYSKIDYTPWFEFRRELGTQIWNQYTQGTRFESWNKLRYLP